MSWYFNAFAHYFQFSGRSRRRAYWYFILFNTIATLIAAVLDVSLGLRASNGEIGIIGGIYGLLSFIPGIALSVRRLHDTDKSGWWFLILLVPFVGIIVFIVFAATDGTPGANRFGPDPKRGEVPDALPVI